MSEQALNTLLNEINTGVRRIIGAPLSEVILYGSFARGDFDDESDIDIALIIDLPRVDLTQFQRDLVRLASDLSLDNDVVISIHSIPTNDFEYYRVALPYYRNIDTQGVRLNA